MTSRIGRAGCLRRCGFFPGGGIQPCEKIKNDFFGSKGEKLPVADLVGHEVKILSGSRFGSGKDIDKHAVETPGKEDPPEPV